MYEVAHFNAAPPLSSGALEYTRVRLTLFILPPPKSYCLGRCVWAP